MKDWKQYAIMLLIALASLMGYDLVVVEPDGETPEQVQGGDGFEPISLAEINARPAKSCDITYLIEDEVLLTHKLNIVPARKGAPCNCAAAVPIPYRIIAKITVPDRGYAEAELLSLVKPPYPDYLIGQWNNPKISVLPPKRPCPDLPRKEQPKLPEAVQG